MGPKCFYQFVICLLKIVHHIYLFQENQVPVDNLMLLLLRRKTHARSFLGPIWIGADTVPLI